MANVLPTEKKIAIISSLCEGSSIRSIERMTSVHRDTIMRLGVKVGQGWVYAWMHATEDPANPKRHVTVLHVPPAVQAAIVQEYKDRAVN